MKQFSYCSESTTAFLGSSHLCPVCESPFVHIGDLEGVENANVVAFKCGNCTYEWEVVGANVDLYLAGINRYAS